MTRATVSVTERVSALVRDSGARSGFAVFFGDCRPVVVYPRPVPYRHTLNSDMGFGAFDIGSAAGVSYHSVHLLTAVLSYVDGEPR